MIGDALIGDMLIGDALDYTPYPNIVNRFFQRICYYFVVQSYQQKQLTFQSVVQAAQGGACGITWRDSGGSLEFIGPEKELVSAMTWWFESTHPHYQNNLQELSSYGEVTQPSLDWRFSVCKYFFHLQEVVILQG